jgi:hypothetical protein
MPADVGRVAPPSAAAGVAVRGLICLLIEPISAELADSALVPSWRGHLSRAMSRFGLAYCTQQPGGLSWEMTLYAIHLSTADASIESRVDGALPRKPGA